MHTTDSTQMGHATSSCQEHIFRERHAHKEICSDRRYFPHSLPSHTHITGLQQQHSISRVNQETDVCWTTKNDVEKIKADPPRSLTGRCRNLKQHWLAKTNTVQAQILVCWSPFCFSKILEEPVRKEIYFSLQFGGQQQVVHSLAFGGSSVIGEPGAWELEQTPKDTGPPRAQPGAWIPPLDAPIRSQNEIRSSSLTHEDIKV